MGPQAAMNRAAEPSKLVLDEIRRERFGRYFPRLFAYAQHLVGDEAAAKAIVIDSFTQAFDSPVHLADEEFLLAIIGHARDLCRGGNAVPGDHLSHREREVISLLFDAQLSRQQIGVLTRMKDDAVNGALLKGLRKLRAMTTAIPPAYLRAN